MKKVMVFNFKTMQFEEVSEPEGQAWLDLINSLNTDCAAEHEQEKTKGAANVETSI